MVEVVRAAATVSLERAIDFAARAFAATGVPEDQARKAAEALVDADLHGTVTHGLKNLRQYIAALLDGKINPRARIQDVSGGAAARVLSADNALGHVAGHAGMERAIGLAGEYGIGTALVRDSSHWFRWFVLRWTMLCADDAGWRWACGAIGARANGSPRPAGTGPAASSLAAPDG